MKFILHIHSRSLLLFLCKRAPRIKFPKWVHVSELDLDISDKKNIS